MIRYLYDTFGWYAGEGGGRRSTLVAPTNLSLTTTPGEQRANWTGFEWVDLPYAARTPPLDRVVPQEVTMRQARLALLDAGLLNNVTGAINSLGPQAKKRAEIEWEYSSTLQRTNAFVATLGAALGLNDKQIDALFIAAEKL